MLTCKLCKEPPHEKYAKARNKGTRFTCGRCADEQARIAESPQSDCAALFAQAAFIFETWDQGNHRAAYLMDAIRSRLDPRATVRISQQINDLSLRQRWQQAVQNGDPLPRVHQAVASHFSAEFKSLFRGGSDPSEHPMQTRASRGSLVGKRGGDVG